MLVTRIVRTSGAGPLASLVLGLLAGGAAVAGHSFGVARLGVSILEWQIGRAHV